MHKAKYLLYLYLLQSAIFGVALAFMDFDDKIEQNASGFVFAFLGSLNIFFWYYYDSEAQRFRRSMLLNSLVSVLALVGVPIYLILSREKGKKLRSLVKCFFFFLLSLLLIVVCNIGAMMVSDLVHLK